MGLGLEGTVPDAKTVWLYHEQLAQAGVIERLFDDFDGHLRSQGYLVELTRFRRRSGACDVGLGLDPPLVVDG